MALNSSGQLSLGGATSGESVNLELNKSATAVITMNDSDLRTLFGIGSGQISMSNGYGKSSLNTNAAASFIAWTYTPITSPVTGVPNVFEYGLFKYNFITDTGGYPSASGTTVTGGGVNTTQKGYSIGDPYISAFNMSTEVQAVEATTGWDGSSPATGVLSGVGCGQTTSHGYNFGATYTFTPYTNPAVAPTSSQYSATQGGGKYNFSTQTLTKFSTSFSQLRTGTGGASDQNRGYYGCGIFPAPYTPYNGNVNGLAYSTDTALNLGGQLNGRGQVAAINSATKAYFAGGNVFTPGGLGLQNNIDGMTFATDSGFDIGAGLVAARYQLTGISSGPRGLWAGGYTGPSSTTTEVDGLDYATESTINPAANLTRSTSASTSGGNSRGQIFNQSNN